MFLVTPAKAGVYGWSRGNARPEIVSAATWIPAFAGMTALFTGTSSFTRLPCLLDPNQFAVAGAGPVRQVDEHAGDIGGLG